MWCWGVGASAAGGIAALLRPAGDAGSRGRGRRHRGLETWPPLPPALRGTDKTSDAVSDSNPLMASALPARAHTAENGPNASMATAMRGFGRLVIRRHIGDREEFSGGARSMKREGLLLV